MHHIHSMWIDCQPVDSFVEQSAVIHSRAGAWRWQRVALAFLPMFSTDSPR